MADGVTTLISIPSTRAGALRPCIVPQFTAVAMAAPARGGFVPVIDWPERFDPAGPSSSIPRALARYRFPRKIKATAEAALAYAERRIHYTQIRAAAKCRRHELRCSPYPFSIAAE